MINIFRINHKLLFDSILFCFLFICLQVFNFVGIIQFNITTYIPYLLTLVVLFWGHSLPLWDDQYKSPRLLFILSVIGSVLSLFAGNGPGDMLLKIMYAIFGFVGFVYISEKKVIFNLFPIILIGFYIYFYSVFFYDTSNLRVGDFFGISSSNTIAISLNGIFYFYYLLQKYNKKIEATKLIAFSSMNLYFIWIQGSRIGVVTAFFLVIVSLYEFFQEKVNSKILSTSLFLLLSIVAITFLYTKYSFLLDAFIEDNGALGINAYEEDCRAESQKSFFEHLTPLRILFGYNISFAFFGDLHRTFNSFLDFWARYTLIPFIILVYQVFRRIFRFKNFEIPIYALIPFFFYAFVESVWSGALWDIMLYIACFLSDKNIEVLKNQKK